MRLPILTGTIDRRILVNYRVEPDAMARQLPPPFRPKLYDGHAIGGICLIRLKRVRPRGLPGLVGLGSENAAHRIAVQWEEDGTTREGVYIPRRDTDSRINALAGGRLFPGTQHRARFDVHESHPDYAVSLVSRDGATRVAVTGRVTDDWPAGSVFPTLAEASTFFASGALGYSATSDRHRFDGMELACRTWAVEALAATDIESSFFNDPERFAPGTTQFDCALLMRDIEHQWISRKDLCCPAEVVRAH